MATRGQSSGQSNEVIENDEVLDDDAIELIDCVTDLAVLKSEFEEVKKNIALTRNNGLYQPIKLFRSNDSVSVSDVSCGLWCELQVEYRHLYPFLQRTKEWQRRKREGKSIERKTTTMYVGSNIHLKKEIEIHGVPVPIITTSKEDQWAVELINTYAKLALIKEGNIGAEIKVFGLFFDTILSGVIDQIQYCVKENSLILLELKTRQSQTLPGSKQKQGHFLQLMLYKMLLDALTQSDSDYCSLVQKLGLKLTRALSPEPVKYMHENGLLLLGGFIKGSDHYSSAIVTLKDLINLIDRLIRGLQLPIVDTLLVQYVYQGNDAVLGVEEVINDGTWALKELKNSLEFWSGKRKSVGVDVEDSWKCQSCQFSEVCVWRKNQVAQGVQIKKWPSVFI